MPNILFIKRNFQIALKLRILNKKIHSKLYNHNTIMYIEDMHERFFKNLKND